MNFDQPVDRSKSDSYRWRAQDPDILPLWVADMDFVSPPEVIQALHERVDHGVFGYGMAPEGLEEVIVARCQRKYGWLVQKDQFSFIPGVVTGFNLALRTVCAPGDGVIFQTPAYPPFFSAPGNGGFKAVHNPMPQDAEGNFHLDLDLFEEQIVTENVRAFLLCNPQNPTGRMFTREELTRLAEICLRHRVAIVSDEIHCDLVFDGRQHIPIASLSAEVSENTITLTAPSKTFNIAGLHASLAIVQNPELLERLEKARKGMVGHPGLLALVGAKAAYEHGDGWLDECLAYLQANRDWLCAHVPEMIPGARMTKPEATYLAWIDFRGAGIEDPYTFFIEQARVRLNDGQAFGEVGRGFARLNFGTQRANLEEALARMSSAYRKANPGR